VNNFRLIYDTISASVGVQNLVGEWLEKSEISPDIKCILSVLILLSSYVYEVIKLRASRAGTTNH
jgi:hypothetical protein